MYKRQVVVCADGEAGDLVHVLRLGGEHEYREVVLLADFPAEGKAADVGEHHVQDGPVSYTHLGYGDKYHHAQGNYFPQPIYTEDGIPRYKLEDGKAVERTEEEIEADRAAIPEPGPRAEDVTLDMLAEHEARLCMLELTTTI